MASSGIVNMDTSEEKFWVSEHHVPVLQRGGKLSRLAMQTLCIPMLSEGYRSVVDCFKLDGQQGAYLMLNLPTRPQRLPGSLVSW